jgi:hypothetical protein
MSGHEVLILDPKANLQRQARKVEKQMKTKQQCYADISYSE